MYYLYFDSGTTNTRAYLIQDKTIILKDSIPTGSRDSALHRDRSVLMDAIVGLYKRLLCQAGLKEHDIHKIFLSGMISCPSGLVEIEHLSVPVDLPRLKSGIVSYYDRCFFKREVFIVPGVKTLPQGVWAAPADIACANNIRGEEIEVMGILRRFPDLGKGYSIILLPGSHTQAVFLTDGRIENISSNVTGELYHAIISDTILSSSLKGDSPQFLPDMARMGYRAVHSYGFNRALYMVRSMELFSHSTLSQRFSYMEGVLNAGVMDAITAVAGAQRPASVAVAGPHLQYQIFSALAKEQYPQLRVVELSSDNAPPFSVEGFLSLVENDER